MVKRHRIKLHSKAWHEFRKNGIGASEASSVLAMDSKVLADLVYTPPIKLHLQKIGEPVQEFTGNQASEAGRFQEKNIVQLLRHHDFENPDGTETYRRANRKEAPLRKVIQPNCYFTNSKYPQLFASPDGLVYPDYNSPTFTKGAKPRAGSEAKLTNSFEANKYKNRVSPSFVIQCYQNMMVVELDTWHLAILIDGIFFEVISLKADQEIFDQINYSTTKFWMNVIKARDIKEGAGLLAYYNANPTALTEMQLAVVEDLSALEPDLTGSDRELEFIKEMMIPTPEETTMIGTEEQRGLCINYLKAGEAIKAIESEKTLYTSELIKSLQGTHVAKFDDGKEGYFSYKPNKNGKASIYVSPKCLNPEPL